MIKSFVKEVDQYLFCDKKGLHIEEPLDLVCTSPLCRQNPLACSVCFDERHKHHNVLSLSKFIDEFSRQAKNFDKKLLHPQIARIHKSAKGVCNQLRKNINQKLDEFEKDIDDYADYLYGQINQRDEVYKLVNLEATPERLSSTINLSQLRKGIKFILNNSKFDDDVEMCKIAAPLRQANEKLQSLVSKLEYVSFNCMRRVEAELGRMKELRQTIDDLKREDIKVVNDDETPSKVLKIPKSQASEQSTKLQKIKVESGEKAIASSIKPFITPFKTEQKSSSESPQASTHTFEPPKFKFTMKHPQLTLVKQTIKSNVHGKQAQYVLATPSLTDLPTSRWMLKIIKCKEIFCNSSLAVGICHLNQLKRKHFEARVNNFEDCYMLSSAGDVITPLSITNNPEMKFKSGDLLQLQFDSYYQLLQIKNQQGSILSLKVEKREDDPLFICVRMTFAEDSVELLNY